MKALTIAVIAILAAAAMAFSAEMCTDTTCSNCTNAMDANTTVSGDCYTNGPASQKIVCSGDNVTVSVFANTDCSGTTVVPAISYKVGCNVLGTQSLKVSCGASAATVVVAVAAIVAALLF